MTRRRPYTLRSSAPPIPPRPRAAGNTSRPIQSPPPKERAPTGKLRGGLFRVDRRAANKLRERTERSCWRLFLDGKAHMQAFTKVSLHETLTPITGQSSTARPLCEEPGSLNQDGYIFAFTLCTTDITARPSEPSTRSPHSTAALPQIHFQAIPALPELFTLVKFSDGLME